MIIPIKLDFRSEWSKMNAGIERAPSWVQDSMASKRKGFVKRETAEIKPFMPTVDAAGYVGATEKR